MKTILDAVTNVVYDFVVSNEETGLIPARQTGITTIPSQSTTVNRRQQTRQPDIPDIPIDQLALIRLNSILDHPIKECELLEQYGRIALLRYVPYTKPCPVIPISLVDLGQGYTKAVKKYAEHLGQYGMFTNPASWGKKMRKLLDSVIRQIDRQSHLLRPGEVWYLKTHFALSAADPRRVTANASR